MRDDPNPKAPEHRKTATEQHVEPRVYPHDGRMVHRLGATPREAPPPGLGRATGNGSLDAMIAAMDVHVGTSDNVIASLQTDSTLTRATDVAVQVHPIDPPHPFILRSIELIAEVVAAAFGWGRDPAGVRRVA